ncbi:hypothetical protein BaRGS_00025847 [Batillaria attramentaria]|uniref:Uncharacterized protein n=1 Tax=Batillaria attramentaria TaxID=370345 RepID=A0ABD0K690_9CAEN
MSNETTSVLVLTTGPYSYTYAACLEDRHFLLRLALFLLVSSQNSLFEPPRLSLSPSLLSFRLNTHSASQELVLLVSFPVFKPAASSPHTDYSNRRSRAASIKKHNAISLYKDIFSQDIYASTYLRTRYRK